MREKILLQKLLRAAKRERERGMGNAAPSRNLSVAQPARLDEGSLIQAISSV